MQYLMIGFLKKNVGDVPEDVQRQTNDFLGQPLLQITRAGELKDAEGRRAGMMIMIDCVDRTAAEAFLNSSPYAKANLYEDLRIFEYKAEVGFN